jgi:hypothetical protein
MSAALLMAALLVSGETSPRLPVQSTPEECEFLHALLIANWPPEYKRRSTLNLDRWGHDRPQFFEDSGGLPVLADSAFVREFFPQLGDETASEFAAYFAVGPDYQVDCTFDDLPIRPAVDTLRGREGPAAQVTLKFPRISITQPIFSADGQYGLGGVQWSFVAGYWFFDHCLFNRTRGEWRIVECLHNPVDPLDPDEADRRSRLPPIR